MERYERELLIDLIQVLYNKFERSGVVFGRVPDDELADLDADDLQTYASALDRVIGSLV
jgi:hypothetical protein